MIKNFITRTWIRCRWVYRGSKPTIDLIRHYFSQSAKLYHSAKFLLELISLFAPLPDEQPPIDHTGYWLIKLILLAIVGLLRLLWWLMH